MPLRTALTDMLGIEHPIIQGGTQACYLDVCAKLVAYVPITCRKRGMQYVGYAEMAAAVVTKAGGLGILTGLTQPSPEALRADARLDKPFGVNLTILPALIPADYDAYARVLAEEKVTLVELAAGSPKKYTPMWKAPSRREDLWRWRMVSEAEERLNNGAKCIVSKL
eukprot:Skav228368  [mRNA]  locus=scaffold1981:197821:207700:+ [translate_table: standard]